jgi:hypothetical protein
MTRDEAIRRAQRAREILEDDLVREVLAEMQAGLFSEWQGTRVGETVERERLYMLHCAVKDFETRFKGIIETGKVAQHRIDQERLEAEAERLEPREDE